MEIKSFRDMRVWNAGMELAVQIYQLSQGFPSDERFGLISQMRRASVSVPSNIAEGYLREGTGEYLYHISVAQGSLAELDTQIELAARLGYLTTDQAAAYGNMCAALCRQLFALRNALQRRRKQEGTSGDNTDLE